MATAQSIPVVDLFAGPGGLGEGFAAGLPGGRRPFELIISAESDPAAHRTLKLRAFKHLYEHAGENLPAAYHDLAAGKSSPRFDRLSKARWAEAGERALRLTLGDRSDDACLDRKLSAAGIGPDVPWVLIGGPPCQAYSLVGRARNRGNAKYRPNEDKRHRLYEEYLRVIRAFSPPVFVMENVKGLLSSTYGGQRIFEKILADLAQPSGRYGVQYNIHALSSNALYEPGMNPADLEAHSFVVEAERHGVPQRRHRVFLVGIRQDVDISKPALLPFEETRTVFDVLGGMPRLRSKLTKEPDCNMQWEKVMADNVAFLRSNSGDLPQSVRQSIRNYRATGLAFPLRKDARYRLEKLSGWTGATLANGEKLRRWIRKQPPRSLQNHEPRGHMRSDLARYLFCTLYAAVEKRSPTAAEFPGSLAPKHANWTSGKFTDRFRVQVAGQPSSTITSHISKDGHYYIHPDISQCRSLSVREAARLQTFPDSYVFLGNRTEQYIQVGNAVPPYLANKIALVIANLFASLSVKDDRVGRDVGVECLLEK